MGNYSYFIQKRDEERAAAAPDSSAALPGEKKPGKSRELRRLEAEERNQRGKIKKEITRELHKLEAEIMELEAIKARNQELLCDPEVLKESLRIKPLMKELKEAERQLNELLPQWEKLIHSLEDLETK